MMSRVAGLVLAVVVVAIAAACDVVTATNPFDPATPADQQQTGSLIGRVAFVDDLSTTVRQVQLEGVRVSLLGEDGRALEKDGETVTRELVDVDADANFGGFVFDDVVPGVYTVIVDGVGLYTPPQVSPLRLLPGATLDVGTLTFTLANAGPGTISGEVLVNDGDAQRTVSLFEKSGDEVSLVGQTLAGAGGAFAFRGLEPGSYAVVAESAGHAPAWRLDVDISAAQLQVAFAGDDAIVLPPVSGVVQPEISPSVLLDDGVFYVAADSVTVDVFAGIADPTASLGVSGLRLSTSGDFTDVAFTPFSAQNIVALPAREGRIDVFAQLEARSAGGFVFTSPVFTMSVIRDVTPPVVLGENLAGFGKDVDGNFLVDNRALVVAFDAQDDVSGVDRVAIADGVVAPDPLTFDDVTAPPGLVRFSRTHNVPSDGTTNIFVRLRDKAGNESVLTTLPAIVDTTAPDVALVVGNASGGVLPSRIAQLSFDTSGAVTDLPETMQLRIRGRAFGDEVPFGDAIVVVDSSDGGDTDEVIFEARVFDHVGNSTDLSATVNLRLRGDVAGRVAAAAVPLITPDHSGAIIAVGSTEGTSAADGSFVVVDVVEGVYDVSIALDGYDSALIEGVAVSAEGVTLPTTPLQLSRGDLRVEVDVDGGGAATGVIVSVALDGAGRSFVDAVPTDQSGAATFSSLPATRAGESYRVEVLRADDGATALASSIVVKNTLTTVNLSLAAAGDFDLCRASGPCDATTFLNAENARVRLRGAFTDVDSLVVVVDGGTPTTVPFSIDNQTPISFGTVSDGRHDLVIQPRGSGVDVGGALRGSVIVDRVAPTNATLTRVQDAAALDARFTRQAAVIVVANADVGSGDVAPASSPRLVVAASVPATPPAELFGCTNNLPCTVTLAANEGLQRVFSFSCDKAGNCAAPVDTFVIRDVTPPAGGHGVVFDVTAANSVTQLGVVVLPTFSYRGSIAVGAARDGNNVAVVDESGAAVADVFAFATSLDATTLSQATLRTFSTPPVADSVRAGADVVVPALEPIDTVQTVFVDVRDAAGNAIVAPLQKSLRIDDDPPSLIVSVAAATNSRTLPFAVSSAAGGEVPSRVDVSVDQAPPTTFPLPLVGASVTLPDVDGGHDVEFAGVDAVGNATVVVRRVSLDRGAPRVDLVRCTAAACNADTGAGTLLTTATALTLAVTAADDASVVASFEVTVGASTNTFAVGSPITAVVPANTTSNLSVVAIDAVGNRSTALVRSVRHDSVPPSLTSVTVNAGATVTRDRNVDVVVAGASADVAAIAVGNGAVADCRVAVFVAFAATTTLTLTAGDGSKTVGVCLKDGNGNVTASSTNASITLDTTPPQAASIVLAGGATITRATSLTATVSASGADTMKVVTADNDSDVEAFVAFVGTVTNVVIEDTAADGVKSVLVVLRDLAGNEVTASTSIQLDRAAPTAPSVVINGGAAVTSSASVTLTLSALGASEVQIAPDGTADTEAFVPVSATALTTLAGADCAAGVACKTVQVIFRDAAGNLSTPASDSISLDSAAPGGTSLTLASSVATDTAGFATSTTVSATMSYPADAVRFKLAEGAADCTLAAGFANLDGTSPDTAAITVSVADGQKVVVACFADAAGNSSSTTASIVLDRARPVGSILVNNNASSANGTAVTVAVAPQSDDVNRVAFVNDVSPTCNNSLTYQTLSSSMAHTLADLDGSRTVFACFRDVAGNFSFAPVSDGISLDRTVPAVVFDISGSAGAAPGDGAVKFSKSRDTIVNVSSLSADATGLAVVNGSVVATCAAQAFEDLDQPVQLPLTRSFVLSDADGVRDVTVCAKDGAGNVSGIARAITLDRAAPAGSIALTTTGGLVTSTTIAGTLTITPVATDALRAVASADPAIDCGAVTFSGVFGTLSSSISQVVPTGDGQKFVVRCLQDQAGNLTKVSSSATLDGTRPTLATFTLDNGGAFSLDTTVTADFTGVATDVTQMVVSRAAIADCAAATFVAFSNGSNVTGLVEGTNTVSVCLRDSAGNVSDIDAATAGAQPFTDTIVVDTQNPTLADFAVGGIGGPAPNPTFIASKSAVVKINRTDLAGDVVAVAIDNTTINCATASYDLLPQPVPASISKSIELAAGSDGARTVAVCVKDSAGRTNGATGLTRSITLDTTAPSLTTFTINAGASITNDPRVTMTLASNPANDPLLLQFFTDPATDCSSVAFSGTHAALPATSSANLTATSGSRFVVGCVQDRAGNISGVADDIELDVGIPGGPATVCSGCNIVADLGFTNTTDAVALAVTGVDVDVVSALTMVTEDETEPRGQNRTCTVDANCRVAVGEQCRSFPVSAGVAGGPPTLALRCVEVQPDLDNIFVSLATAAAPVAAGSGVPATTAEGIQKLAIAVVDTAGNVSDAKDFLVVRDITAPTPTFAVAGLTGTGITNQQTVFIRTLTVLNESAIGGAIQVGSFQASSLTTFADAAVLSYTAAQASDAFPVTLSNGDGSKSVAVRFVDNAGNVNNTAASAVVVALDATSPTDPAFSNSAQAISGSGSVNLGALAIQSTDANLRSPRPYNIVGLTNCASIVGITVAFGNCEWNGTTPLLIAAANLTEGENRLRVSGRDTATNVSNEDFLSLTKDSTAPQPASNPRVQERSGSITFTWSPSTSADVVGYLVEYGNDDAAPGLTPGNFAAEGPSPVFVPSPQTGITLTGLSDDTGVEVRVLAVDGVQNRSVPSATVVGLPNPITPTTVSTLTRIGGAGSTSLMVRGPRAFAQKGTQVCGYNVADPAAMSERASSCATLAVGDRVKQFGRFLYLTNENAALSLRLVDTTVNNPATVSIDLGANDNLEDVAFAGRSAFGIRLVAGAAQLVTLQQPSSATNNVSGLWTIAQTVTAHEGTASNLFTLVDGSADFVDANMNVGMMVTTQPFASNASVLMPFTINSNGLVVAVGNSLNNTGLLRGAARSLRIDGKRAYVGTTAGLFIARIDTNSLGVGNTVRAVIEGSIGGFECSALDVMAGYAYCNDSSAGASNRLNIIDVADTTNPQLAGRLVQTPNSGLTALDVEDNNVYGIRTDGSIEAISLWSPTRFAIDGVDGDEAVFDAVIDGNLVYGVSRTQVLTFIFGSIPVPVEKGAFVTWDISDRTNPTRLSTVPTLETGLGFPHGSLAGHMMVFALDNGRAMHIVDPVGGVDLANLIRVNTSGATGNCPAATSGNSVDIAAFGNYAVIASNGNGGELEVWSLNHRNGGVFSTLCLSRVSVPNIRRVSDVVDAQVATMSTDGTLRIVDLSVLTSPTVVAAKTVVGLGNDVDGFGDVEFRGDHVYVGRSGAGNSGSVRRISLVGIPSTTQTLARSVGGIAVVGNTVIAAEGRRINTSQASDVPSLAPGLLFLDPQAAAFTPTTQTLAVIAPWRVIVAGPTLIGASDGNGLQLLTVTR